MLTLSITTGVFSKLLVYLAFNAKFLQVITQKYLEMANHKRLLFSSKQSPMIANK